MMENGQALTQPQSSNIRCRIDLDRAAITLLFDSIFWVKDANKLEMHFAPYLNTDRILEADLNLRCICRDVIARFVRQFVASEFRVETRLRRRLPNQTQTRATRAQPLTNKLWTTTWTYKSLLEQTHRSHFVEKCGLNPLQKTA